MIGVHIMKTELVHGNSISPTPVQKIKTGEISICGTTQEKLILNKDLFSKHFMLLGATGSGKSNFMYHLIRQTKSAMTDKDVMIVFDTKGDYYRRFYDDKNDVVIASSKEFEKVATVWNIFKEIVADGYDFDELESNINEISWSIFADAIEGNKSQPFFPNAARGLFAAMLSYIVRIGKLDQEFKKKYFNNKEFKVFLDKIQANTLNKLLKNEKDLQSVLNYIGDGSSQQALGVFAELQSVVRNIFTGSFAKDGRFSVREFIRNKGKKALFIEYDLSKGHTLTPIYRLLIDLALKEALGRTEDEEGSVYVFCDEFKLLPHLTHIEDAVNFGRGLGVKVCIGLQSIEQLYEGYGEYRGRNIATGFSSLFAFKMNDSVSREYVVGRYGKNLKLEQYRSFENPINQSLRDGNTIEDWDICNLSLGEMIVGLPYEIPFKFKSELYK